jgi:NADH:ubiquinone oxidoreductase subunit 6 (subunit J)
VLFYVLLFASLFAGLYLLTVSGEYEVSPAAMAVDAVKRTVGGSLLSGRKQEIISTIGKSASNIIKTGILSGVGLGALFFLLTFKFIGTLSIILAAVGFVLGILFTGTILENEFKKWQNQVLEGIPALVTFMPAFLEIEGITPREALSYTVNFLPEPLKGEMEKTIDTIRRTGRIKQAMDRLAKKVGHPLFDTICFRISAAWDAKVTPDIFTDLADQVDEMNELAISRATVAKTGFFALVCVLGLIGIMLIYVYPGIKLLMMKLSGSFI